MTKSQLIESIVASGRFPRKTVEVAVNAIFDAMIDALKTGDRIEIRGFGNFTVREYRAYTGRNPKTGALVDVDSKRMPFFKVGKDLRERINGLEDLENVFDFEDEDEDDELDHDLV